MPQEFVSPVGRIVFGHPAKAQDITHADGPQKGQKKLDATGQPMKQWVFGLAIDKATFAAQVYPYMDAEARTGYPNGVPPRFAWKYDDGDGIDSNGKPFSEREGYAGCYVLKVATQAFAPPIYKRDPSSPTGYRQMQPDEVKTGDYVAVGLNLKVNVATGTNTPSLYVNPTGIEHVGYGQEIISRGGIDPAALFGGVQHQLPPGASATPLQAPAQPGAMPGMPQPGAMPGMPQPGAMPGMPQPGAMPGYPAAAPQQMPGVPQGYPQPGVPQGAMPGQMPPPAHDFVQNAGMPQAGYPQPGVMPGQMPGR